MTNILLKGHAKLVLEDTITGEKEIYEFHNTITQYTKEQVTKFLLGERTPLLPRFIGIGTGDGSASDQYTALLNPEPYGMDIDLIAKESHSIQRLGLTTVRFITSFIISEANFTITELGLYDGEDINSKLWARLVVNITKTNLKRLTIYWYIDFNEVSDFTFFGESIKPINILNTLDENTRYIYNFQASMYKVLLSMPIKEKDVTSHMRIKINPGIGWNNNNIWDYKIYNGEYLIINNLEIFRIGLIYVVSSGQSDPDILKNFIVKGWN